MIAFKFFSAPIIMIMLSSLVQLRGNEYPLWHEAVDALVESDEVEFEIVDVNKARMRVKRLGHIFNDRGKKYAAVTVTENAFVKCKRFEGAIMDMNGRVLKKARKEDIRRSHISPGYALYDDDTYRELELPWRETPYKFSYSYELEINSLFFWPDWLPQENIPVLKSTYALILRDETFEYRIYNTGIDIQPRVQQTKRGKEMLWQIENIEPRDPQEYWDYRNSFGVRFTAVNFALGDHQGCFDSWDGVADWYASLADRRYELPPEAKEKVKSLIEDEYTDDQKIQTLYSFLQEHTRYVAINLGVGGWQPHSAESVFTNKYGDCKDLSTLMISMLREVGIRAYPALTPTRNYLLSLIRDYPSNQFNHCITFVPLAEDTVWLECTADYLTAGTLPATVEGCEVLVVKEEGGEIIRTPQSKANDNTMISQIRGNLTSIGMLYFNGQITLSGNVGCDFRNFYLQQEPRNKENWVRRLVGRNLPNLNLNNLFIGNVKDHVDRPALIEFEGTINNFAASNASRLFLNPNLFNRQEYTNLIAGAERSTPVVYPYARTYIDSLEIILPAGYTLEAAPEPQNISTPFGYYQSDFSFADQKFNYRRIYRIDVRLIPPEQFPEFTAFLKWVTKNDAARFVFKK